MKIAVIGTGYVGLVTATCFAESGNDVIGIDKDADKIKILENDRIPIYEPGLLELVIRNRRDGRLTFTSDLATAINKSDIVFVAVGTPQSDDGHADLTNLWAVAEAIAQAVKEPITIVIKSTVPVGTNKKFAERIAALTSVQVDVANNPEFLKEGTALDDFMKPDRVVVGVRRPEVAKLLQDLHAPFLRTEKPFLAMSPESAEMTKYVANAMLATKISFINEMANLCEFLDADINDVRRGIGHDARIGFQFLFPGVGWGGSCFPKDVQALMAIARDLGYPARIIESVYHVNDVQKSVLSKKIEKHYGQNLKDKTLAIWGLAFKPRTDDIREAPSLTLLSHLVQAGCKVRVHDPEAMENTKHVFGDRIVYCETPYDTLENCHGLVIVTEWQEFRHPNFDRVKELLIEPVVFDGRNLYETEAMRERGFTYYSIGRK